MKKLTTLTGIALAVGLAVSTPVQATTLASAVLGVTNAVLYLGDPDNDHPLTLIVDNVEGDGNIVGTSTSDITDVNGNNTAEILANLNSVGGPDATDDANVGILDGGGAINLGQVSQGTPPVGDDDYTGLTNPIDPQTTNPPSNAPDQEAPDGSNFADADMNLSGAIITIDQTTTGGGVVDAGADAEARSDVGLASDDSGNANASVGTDTSFVFQVSENTTLTFQGDFSVNLESYVDPDAVSTGLGSNAQANAVWAITIEDLTENLDVLDATLVDEQTSRNAGTAGNPDTYDFVGTLTATSDQLIAGHLYELTINHQVVVRAKQTTPQPSPEPASLLLFGAGLLGLGAAKRAARTQVRRG